jgi:hypothetical protein
VLSDPLFTQRWRHGVTADAGVARDLVTGNLFTRLGRRVVHIFDHEQGGQVSSVVVAVQRRSRDADLVVELWLPDQPLPQDPQLTRLGTVGERIAVVSDPNRARTLMTADFVFAANSLGADIAVAWLEQDWVLAAAPCTATPTRLERLLRALGEIADLLDVPPADETADTTAIADRGDLSRWATSESDSTK